MSDEQLESTIGNSYLITITFKSEIFKCAITVPSLFVVYNNGPLGSDSIERKWKFYEKW